MEHLGDKSKLDGAGLYGTPWDLKAGFKFFYNNLYGFYAYGVGMNLVNTLQKDALPGLLKYCSKEEGERLTESFRTNWSGLPKLDTDLYVPMFGFKSCDEYYERGTVAGRLNQIKTPTIALAACDDNITPNFTNPFKEC